MMVQPGTPNGQQGKPGGPSCAPVGGWRRCCFPCHVPPSAKISVGLSPFAPRKPRSFAGRRRHASARSEVPRHSTTESRWRPSWVFVKGILLTSGKIRRIVISGNLPQPLHFYPAGNCGNLNRFARFQERPESSVRERPLWRSGKWDRRSIPPPGTPQRAFPTERLRGLVRQNPLGRKAFRLGGLKSILLGHLDGLPFPQRAALRLDDQLHPPSSRRSPPLRFRPGARG